MGEWDGLPEIVGTSSTLLQVGSEERLGERGLDSIKESLLCLGLDSIDCAESKAKKTVICGSLAVDPETLDH